MSRVDEMAQWRKALKAVAAKADHFHAIPGTHMMGRANSSTVALWPPHLQHGTCTTFTK